LVRAQAIGIGAIVAQVFESCFIALMGAVFPDEEEDEEADH
jgi:hypothetical protein